MISFFVALLRYTPLSDLSEDSFAVNELTLVGLFTAYRNFSSECRQPKLFQILTIL